MIQKYEFIERILYLIRKKLSDLPNEDTLENMMIKTQEKIKEIFLNV